jgi:threonine dehydrogenase-like Zn-dependent dehydrogenase
MKAVTVIPGQKYSAHIKEVPLPEIGDSELLIKSVYCGICNTDREINEGLYGTAPKDSDYLIMGHESLGIVDKLGKDVTGISKGQYVVRSVRRSCGSCPNCLARANDMCTTGGFIESGIKELHGCMAEYFSDTPEYLITIPQELAHVGVLLEPLSVVEKTYRQAKEIQKRIVWTPKKAMIIGAGPIGLLQAMLLTEQNMEVYVVARSKSGNLKSKLVNEIGAQYVSTSCMTLDDLVSKVGKFDFVLEASGDSSMVFESMPYVANNGILCMTSITGGNKQYTIQSDKRNLEFVLGNKIMFGTVNANLLDYENGVKSMARFMKRWPDVLPSMFTRRYSLEGYEKALKTSSDDIKTVIDFN